ncbi:MAG: hypothetical protein ACK47B_21770 [Armatimonadota bacterium]
MIPVEQTILTPPLGNCFAACLASILECPLEIVPHLTREEGETDEGGARYWNRIREWLRPYNLDLGGWMVREGGMIPSGYTVLTVDYGPWWHCVVAKDGEPVWNPDPRRDTAPLPTKWVDWAVLYVRDPARPVLRPGGGK